MNDFKSVKLRVHLTDGTGLGIGLADGTLLSYSYIGHLSDIFVKVETWNGDICEFTFFDALFFYSTNENSLTDFGESSIANPIFKKIIDGLHEKNPDIIDYKYYQFLDVDYEPDVEIFCKRFEIKLISRYRE